jgi:SAM-dependent methyltransferase
MWSYILNGPGETKDVMDAAWGSPDRFNWCDTEAPPFRVLLPGCGTGNPAVSWTTAMTLAHAHCTAEEQASIKWEVVCLDLSSTSLGIARSKVVMLGKEVLSHIRFQRKSLLDLDPQGKRRDESAPDCETCDAIVCVVAVTCRVREEMKPH